MSTPQISIDTITRARWCSYEDGFIEVGERIVGEEATGQRITSSEIVLAALSLLPDDPEAIRELLEA